MTTNVQDDVEGAANGRRSHQRRSEEQMIEDLQAKLREVEDRMKRKEIKASPLHKEFAKFKKHAAKFVQSCSDEQRSDLANSVLGALTVTEQQINALD